MADANRIEREEFRLALVPLHMMSPYADASADGDVARAIDVFTRGMTLAQADQSLDAQGKHDFVQMEQDKIRQLRSRQ